MGFRARLGLVVAGAASITLVALACGGPTSTEIVQTQTALNKQSNATATAEAVIAAGGDVEKKVAFAVGKGSIADQVQETQAAKATAAVEAGEEVAGASSGATVTPVPEIVAEAPEGPPQSGEVEILIKNLGAMDPEAVKITVGTTVIWANIERTNHSTKSDPDQAEQWDSGDMARKVTEKEFKTFSHTFTTPGRYTYGSGLNYDKGRGVIFVVEE